MPSFSELAPILLLLGLLFGAKHLPVLAKSAGSSIRKTAGRTTLAARWLLSSITGSKKDFILAEHAMGREMAKALSEEECIYDDPELNLLLNQILTKLSSGKTPAESLRFEVAVLSKDQPNACALPGGFLFLNSGLVVLTRRDPDELAAVIAHEMSHVILRHSINRVMKHLALTSITRATPTLRSITPWVRKIGLKWFERSHSREQEFEADKLGTELMTKGGFDPNGMIRLLKHFRSLEEPSQPRISNDYFSTHPPTNERVERISEQLA
jgi:predicted Zn-dependent protease